MLEPSRVGGTAVEVGSGETVHLDVEPTAADQQRGPVGFPAVSGIHPPWSGFEVTADCESLTTVKVKRGFVVHVFPFSVGLLRLCAIVSLARTACTRRVIA